MKPGASNIDEESRRTPVDHDVQHESPKIKRYQRFT